MFKCRFNIHNNLKINNKTEFNGEIYGGEIGIMLDGRGRPFTFDIKTEDRKEFIKNWSISTNEYPN